MDLDILLRYEKYIPVLTPNEIEGLKDTAPTLAVLQDWNERLTRRTEKTDAVFRCAYKRQKEHGRIKE